MRCHEYFTYTQVEGIISCYRFSTRITSFYNTLFTGNQVLYSRKNSFVIKITVGLYSTVRMIIGKYTVLRSTDIGSLSMYS